MVDVALIELEGVLLETLELRRTTLRDAFATHGFNLAIEPDIVDGLPPRAAAFATLASVASAASTRAQHDDVLVDLIALRAERLFSAAIATSGAALQPGARSFVEDAAGRGRVGIVTRMSRDDAHLLLRLAGLEEMTTVVVTADDVFDVKPSPDAHRLALSRLHRQRGDESMSVIALEDSAPGIRAAHAAGLRCIAVGPLAPHVAIEADAYVLSLEGQTLRLLDALSVPGRERVQ